MLFHDNFLNLGSHRKIVGIVGECIHKCTIAFFIQIERKSADIAVQIGRNSEHARPVTRMRSRNAFGIENTVFPQLPFLIKFCTGDQISVFVLLYRKGDRLAHENRAFFQVFIKEKINIGK